MVSPGRGSLLPLSPPNKETLSGSSEDPSPPPQAPLQQTCVESQRQLYLCPSQMTGNGAVRAGPRDQAAAATLTPGAAERGQGQKATLGEQLIKAPLQRKTGGHYTGPPAPRHPCNRATQSQWSVPWAFVQPCPVGGGMQVRPDRPDRGLPARGLPALLPGPFLWSWEASGSRNKGSRAAHPLKRSFKKDLR